MSLSEIRKLENELYEGYKKLVQMRRDTPPTEVQNYTFKTLDGETTLFNLFGGISWSVNF